MKGDPYSIVRVHRSPETALPGAWPGKVLVILYNERNTVTCLCVFEDDGRVSEVPSSMVDETVELEALCGDCVRACPR